MSAPWRDSIEHSYTNIAIEHPVSSEIPGLLLGIAPPTVLALTPYTWHTTPISYQLQTRKYTLGIHLWLIHLRNDGAGSDECQHNMVLVFNVMLASGPPASRLYKGVRISVVEDIDPPQSRPHSIPTFSSSFFHPRFRPRSHLPPRPSRDCPHCHDRPRLCPCSRD